MSAASGQSTHAPGRGRRAIKDDMIMLGRVHRAVDRIAALPILDRIVRWRYDRRFESKGGENLFRGVFATYDEALRSAPSNLPKGYDNPASAAMYRDRANRLFPYDYQVLFWLGRLLPEGCTRIFDLGGHHGFKYYAFRRYLGFPASLRWEVHDVPAAMEAGRRIAAEREDSGQLSFRDRFEDASGADVLVAMGSLQYLPETLAERLAKLEKLPGHLIVNGLPLHERLSYFTLNSIGTAYCPYRITAMPEFLRSLEALGYTPVDRWENPDKRCNIPFHPGHSLEGYHGFYFRRGSP